MAGGLVGLLDDIAAFAKLAASSIDDVGVAAGRASAKAAGVVVDDAAVTPAYVQGLAADRELPIIKKIARGSIRNKLLFILPAILLLSEVAESAIDVILICGGAYLCYEGAEKVFHKLKGDDHSHDLPAAVKGPEAEAETIAGAVRTDFILSGEIMVIALNEVIENDLLERAAILAVVAVFITVIVYGVVALIVKMDDIGLSLVGRESESSQKIGRRLVAAMPVVLKWLSIIGTAAMIWVGGHILLISVKELGWKWPYDLVHSVEESVKGVGGIGGILAWLVNTSLSAIVGFIVGMAVIAVVTRLPFGSNSHKEAKVVDSD